jgi:hypothetical protein
MAHHKVQLRFTQRIIGTNMSKMNIGHLPKIALISEDNRYIYIAWRSMKTRCYNSSRREFKYYGGRGIKVCAEWINFINFYNDMSPTYKKGLSLDRIDTNGDYSFNNCRWVNMKIQQNNRRDNHSITFKGETKNICQWADDLGIKRTTLIMRLTKYNWSLEKALGGYLG